MARKNDKEPDITNLIEGISFMKSNPKNIIKPEKDMRKIGDMPEDIRKYYGITLTENNKNEYIDISNGCYIRLIK